MTGTKYDRRDEMDRRDAFLDEDFDDLELFIADQEATDPAFAAALRDAECRSHCIRELVDRRQASGLSQQTVADRMGISQSSVSEFENGGDDVYLSTLQRYARAIDAAVRVVVLIDCDAANPSPEKRSQAVPAPIRFDDWVVRNRGSKPWPALKGDQFALAR